MEQEVRCVQCAKLSIISHGDQLVQLGVQGSRRTRNVLLWIGCHPVGDIDLAKGQAGCSSSSSSSSSSRVQAAPECQGRRCAAV